MNEHLQLFPRENVLKRRWISLRAAFLRAATLFGRLEISELFSLIARRWGDRPLWIVQEPLEVPGFEGPALSANALRDLGYKVANALRRRPTMGANVRVVVAKRNHPDYLVYIFSTIAAGGVPISVNSGTDWGFIRRIKEQTGAAIIVTDEETLARGAGGTDLPRLLDSGVEVLVVSRSFGAAAKRWPATRGLHHFFPDVHAAPASPPPARTLGDDTPVAMFHTSGTTGVPKCCLWDRRNLTRIWKIMMVTLPVGAASRCLLTSPFSHALYSALQPGLLLCGVPTYGMSEFEPKACLATLDRHRITHYLGFPYTFMRMAAEDLSRYRLDSMRLWSTGADKAHAAHIRKLVEKGSVRWGRRRGSVFLDSYGSTEIGAGGIVQLWMPGSRPEPCVQGKPLPTQFAVRIVDREWRDLPRGEVGRILVKSSTHFAGYWNRHDAWAENRIDGFWWGGDVGRLDERGRLVFLDREADSVRTAAGTLYTLPVEERLLGDERVMEAAVFQRTTDFRRGTGEPVAWFVPKGWLRIADKPSEREIAELEAEVRALANAHLPEGLKLAEAKAVSLAELPLGVTGKVLKRELRSAVAPEPGEVAA